MRRLPTIAALLLLGATPIFAQVTLRQCQEKAREHYPEIAQYDLISKSEELSLRTASQSWFPQITLSGQATWQSATATLPEQITGMMSAQGYTISGIPKDQYKVALDIQQTVYDGGLSRANRNLSMAEATQQRLQSDVSIYAIEERVNDIFFGILLLDENLLALRSRLSLLEANEKKLSSLVKEGVAQESDLSLVRVEMLSTGQQISQAEASRGAFVSMLELFIGEGLGGRTLVRPEEPQVPTLSLSQRPELSLLDAGIASLDAREKLLDTQLLPKVAFFAQGYYGNPGLDMFKSMTSGQWSWNAYLGVRLQWNITALFTRGNDLRKIDQSRRSLSLQKDVFQFNSDLQTARQSSEIARMRKALSQDEEILRLRREIRSSAQSQLDNGVIDTATLLQRITEESAAEVNRNLHGIELLKAQYELKHTVNR